MESPDTSHGVNDVEVSRYTFGSQGLAARVSLSATEFRAKSPSLDGATTSITVPINEVLAVEPSPHSREEFTIHYVEHSQENHIWSRSAITLSGPETACEEWLNKLSDAIANIKERPRKLLVIINPESGQKRGSVLYDSQVAPLFALSGVDTDVILTEREFHARDLMQTYDLSSIDGVITVSGDGLYNEVITGLFLRHQESAGKDLTNPAEEWIPVSVPVGLIPAGLGNGVALSCYGNRDIVTSALHIIAGKTKAVRSFSIHEQRKLLAFGGLLVVYGFHGDVMFQAQQSRWMGGIRYLVYYLKDLWQWRTFDAEVECVLEKTTKDQREAKADKSEKEMKTFRANLLNVGHVCMDYDERPNVDLESDTNQGVVNFMYPGSRLGLIKHVYRLIASKRKAMDFDFIKHYVVTGFRIKLTPKEENHQWTEMELNVSCDGENVALSEPEFEVRFHYGIIRLFSSHKYDYEKPS